MTPMPDRSVSLPPIPDTSGEPRPPAAPAVAGPITRPGELTVEHHQAADGARFVNGEFATEEVRAIHAANPILERVVGPPLPMLDHVKSVVTFTSGVVLLP
ncbi:MAG: hypothetical protein ACRDXB_07315, partial [Actinomycetes bacterium]